MKIYRIHQCRFRPDSPSGFPGRWNRVGELVLYAAASIAGAMVEILVHYAAVPVRMCVTDVQLPRSVSTLKIMKSGLPLEWPMDTEITREMGSRWYQAMESAVLIVPSGVAHGENNFLLNTTHPDFENLRFLSTRPFQFDPRLK